MLLKLKNVKKNYKINKNEVQEVLKDINLTLKSGEFVCIYGESGSGKSTLMNIIGGLDDDYIGTVTINKKDIKKIDKDNYRRDKIGFVFQNFNLIPYLSVFENVMIMLDMTNVKQIKKIIKKYERYIRSFMGLLLIYILSVPLLSIVKNSGAVIEDFSRNYNEEVSVLEKKETQNLQGFYIRKGFEQELTSQITKKCEEKGIKIQEVIVDIEGEQISVSLTAGQSLDLQQEGRLKDELRQEFGIKEQNIRIFTGEAGKTAVDRASASGASSVGDRTSGIAEDRYSPTEYSTEGQYTEYGGDTIYS